MSSSLVKYFFALYALFDTPHAEATRIFGLTIARRNSPNMGLLSDT